MRPDATRLHSSMSREAGVYGSTVLVSNQVADLLQAITSAICLRSVAVRITPTSSFDTLIRPLQLAVFCQVRYMLHVDRSPY